VAPRTDLAAQARRFTSWSLAITAASLPLYVLRWHYGPLPTTLLETLILVTAAGFVFMLWQEKRLPERTPYDIPMALWLVAGAIGVIVAPNRTSALGTYRAYFIEAGALFYIAVDLLRSQPDLRRFFAVTGAGAVIYSIGQIVSFVWVTAHHQLQIGDAPAFLNNTPNADAMYLEPPLAFALAMAAFGWSKRERIIAVAIAGIVLLAMILTLSRAGYLAMTALALVLLIYLPSRRLRVWLAGGFALAALVVLEVPFINQRIMTAGASALLRNSIYGQALKMLAQRPIFGAGIDGFPIRVKPFHPPAESVELYPHNLWLTTWSEVGLLGLFVLTFILFALLWRGLKALAHTNELWRPVLWGSVGSVILIIVHGLFDSPYWKNDLSAEFWLVAALQVIAIRGALIATRPAD